MVLLFGRPLGAAWNAPRSDNERLSQGQAAATALVTTLSASMSVQFVGKISS